MWLIAFFMTCLFVGNALKTMKKWYFPLQIVLWRGIENFSKCNLIFFLMVLRLWKMAAEVLFEVKAVGRDLGMVQGCHFSNWKTREKANYMRIIFWTMSEGECFFKFSVFFLWLSRRLLKKFVQVLKKSPKCEKISTHQ